MRPSAHFKHCPRCGEQSSEREDNAPLLCDFCGFTFFFNPCVAAAAIALRDDDKALFIQRAKDPAKGKLAIPGGFIDIGETAEEALRREFKEEVNVELDHIQYLSAHPNNYAFRDVTYPVLDFFFTANIVNADNASALDDVDDFLWLDPHDVDPEDLAFPSIRNALKVFLAGKPF
jgi:ADP-ribose pyrophosphatase YjhB (NUDIX family)